MPHLCLPHALMRSSLAASLTTLVVVVLLALAAAPVAAQSQGDPERGRVLGFTCTGCHGIPMYKNVYPTYTVPKLGGQNQEYLVSALKAYRAGERRHATMQAQASTLSDQDILDITAWLVSVGGGQ
ncbi:MAG: cytochrome c [Wenzhouxiangellaceae bacterium]|nr:cytochrome c [Wenzhouxiangellaceae bacterium]